MSGATICRRCMLVWCAALGLHPASQAQARLQILCGEEPPNNFLEDGRPAGLVVDVVKAVCAALGIDPPIQVMPWTRALANGVSTPGTLLFTMGRTQERVDLGFQFVGPVVTRVHGLYALRHNLVTLQSLDELRRDRVVVGVQRDDWREAFLRERGILTEPALKHEQNIRKLLKGRYHLAVLSDLEAPFMEALVGVKPHTLRLVLPLIEAPSFLGLSRGTSPETVAAWRRSLDDFWRGPSAQHVGATWSARLGRRLQHSPHYGFRVVG